MSDEIKEILKTMKTFNGNLIVENTEVTTLCLTKKESKLLLDYITNLQQKVEQYENPDDLTLFYMWLDEKAKDKMKKLQQENQDLKRMCELYGESLYNADLTKYKSRNNKAIKKLESVNIYSLQSGKTLISALINDVLDILKGDSDE